jgi:hypothetical protein
MRIILNSDVVHMTRPLATGLARHIVDFCREAAQSDAVLVLPRTVILENERLQEKLYNEAVGKLKAAAATLEQWGVPIPAFRPEDMVQRLDLPTALRSSGIPVEIEEPVLADYRDAERRASLHLCPQPPDTNSDEMRDLVIWAVALRVAAKHGSCMLVSRDEVHSHERGLEEANAAKLLRARTLDEALEQLGRISKAGELARSALASIWPTLIAAGLPLPDDVPARRFSRLQFITDDEGHVNVHLGFEFVTRQGVLSGLAHIFQATPTSIQGNFTQLTLDGRELAPHELTVTETGELPKSARPAAERITELRKLIGGE